MPDHPEGKQHEGEHFEGEQPRTKSVPQLILLTKKRAIPGKTNILLLPCSSPASAPVSMARPTDPIAASADFLSCQSRLLLTHPSSHLHPVPSIL
jgi:hypothetical protein